MFEALIGISTVRRYAYFAHAAVPWLAVVLIPFALLGAATAAPKPTSPGTTVVTVAEPSGTISIRAELPTDGKLVRSFRLSQPTPAAPATLSFLPSDLTSASDRVDRSTIQVTDPKPLADVPQDYRLQIEGLKNPGTYTGSLEVGSSLVKGAVQTIPISVVILPHQPIALSPETSKLKLKLASSCGWLTPLILGQTACPATFRVNILSAPGSAQPTDVRLLLAGTNGAQPAAMQTEDNTRPGASSENGQLLLTIPDGALTPDHYTGAIRATYNGGATVIDAPIDLEVRWPAWVPLLIILLGVLGGRYQAYMTSIGTTLGAAYDRLQQLRATVDGLKPASRSALAPALNPVTGLLNDRKPKDAADLLTRLEQCADALRRLDTLEGLGTGLNADQQKIAADARARAQLADGPACASLVDGLANALLPPLGGADQPAEMHPAIAKLSLLAASIIRTRPLAWFFLVLLISVAGLFSLYVSNGAQMGASPLADFVTLLAWGFTSDVAGRTLANFKGA